MSVVDTFRFPFCFPVSSATCVARHSTSLLLEYLLTRPLSAMLSASSRVVDIPALAGVVVVAPPCVRLAIVPSLLRAQVLVSVSPGPALSSKCDKRIVAKSNAYVQGRGSRGSKCVRRDLGGVARRPADTADPRTYKTWWVFIPPVCCIQAEEKKTRTG